MIRLLYSLISFHFTLLAFSSISALRVFYSLSLASLPVRDYPNLCIQISEGYFIYFGGWRQDLVRFSYVYVSMTAWKFTVHVQ